MAKDNSESFVWLEKKGFEILSLIQEDIIYVVDLDWRVRYVNDSAVRMFGKKRTEIIGKKIDDLFPAGVSSRMKENLKKVIERGKAIYVTAPTVFKNSEIWLHNSLSPITAGRGKIVAVLGIGRDVTEERKINQKLAETEKKLQQLLSQMGDGVVIIKDEKIKFLNPRMAGMVGFSVKDALEKNFADFIVKEYLALVIDRRNRRIRGEDVPPRYEIELILKNGGKLPVEINTSVFEYDGGPATISVVRDVTERKKLETALRASESLFRAIFEQAAVGISIISPEGRWLQVNKALSRITGYSEKEMLEKKFNDITYPDDRQASLNARKKLLSGEVLNVELDKRYIRKNKEIIWVNLSITLIRDEKGGPKYFLALTQDINVRKHFEEILNKKMADLERINKIMVGRELKMIELKKEIAELKKRSK